MPMSATSRSLSLANPRWCLPPSCPTSTKVLVKSWNILKQGLYSDLNGCIALNSYPAKVQLVAMSRCCMLPFWTLPVFSHCETHCWSLEQRRLLFGVVNGIGAFLIDRLRLGLLRRPSLGIHWVARDINDGETTRSKWIQMILPVTLTQTWLKDVM